MTFFVGVAGGTASGKSTLCRALADRLGEACLHVIHDRYYHSLPEGMRPLDYNFDEPKALDTARLVRDLDTLRSGQPVDMPQYDFKAHRRHPEPERVAPRPVVVVDGILTLSDDRLRERFDLSVYVDTPDDIRLIRRLRRDMARRGRAAEDVLVQYETTVRPMHERWVAPTRTRADLILDGTLAPQQLLLELLAEIPGLTPP